MRLIRPVLAVALAFAPAASASAEPFDGAESVGTSCLGTVTSSETGYNHYGAISGSVHVFSDVVANNGGAVGVNVPPAPPTSASVTCSIRNAFGTDEVAITRSSTNGVVVVEPAVLAFTSFYTSGFQVCTRKQWTDSFGTHSTFGCLPASR